MGVAVAVLVGVCLTMLRYSALVIERTRVVDAADAVALAGALGGLEAAEDLARRTGVNLVGWVDDGDEVEVGVVGRDGLRAEARAHHRDRAVPISFDLVVPVDELPATASSVQGGSGAPG